MFSTYSLLIAIWMAQRYIKYGVIYKKALLFYKKRLFVLLKRGGEKSKTPAGRLIPVISI
jgi:hypothetical protein